jgi:hypothetical protein
MGGRQGLLSDLHLQV